MNTITTRSGPRVAKIRESVSGDDGAESTRRAAVAFRGAFRSVPPTATGWSDRKSLGLVAEYPDIGFTCGLSMAADGTLYFAGKAEDEGLQNDLEIYRSELKDGTARLLRTSICMFPSSNRTVSGAMRSAWEMRSTPPRQERLPRVSPDGNYLCFTRDNPPNSDDVFWMSAVVIDDLKDMLLFESD